MRNFVRQTLPGKVVFGDGSIRSLPDEVAALGARRVALISGVSPALTTLVAGELPGLVLTWDEVHQHVPVELADRCHEQVATHEADLLVCIGGGSAIGLAKAVALRGGPPVVAIPTTYSGSEMTPIWGQTEGAVKRTGRDARVQPQVVVYDPELVVSLPAEVVGPSGMNALAHCIEGLYSPAAEPLGSLAAVEGARLLVANLPAAYTRSDATARAELLWASCLAGQVLATAGSSLHHALCHLLGGRHNLPHAQTHAVVLPHVLAFVAPHLREQLAPLAAALDVPVDQLPQAVWDVGAAVGTAIGLSSLGMPHSDLMATAQALVDRAPTSPVPLEFSGVVRLLEDAYRGERPIARAKAARASYR